MSSWIIALVVTAGCIAAYYFFDAPATKRKLAKRFAGRPRLRNDEFYNRFFDGTGIPESVVTKVRTIFQDQLGIDLMQLQADDDLSTDFSMIWQMDSLVDVAIVVDLEREFGIKISDDEAKSMRTFRVVVEVVCQKLAK